MCCVQAIAQTKVSQRKWKLLKDVKAFSNNKAFHQMSWYLRVSSLIYLNWLLQGPSAPPCSLASCSFNRDHHLQHFYLSILKTPLRSQAPPAPRTLSPEGQVYLV